MSGYSSQHPSTDRSPDGDSADPAEVAPVTDVPDTKTIVAYLQNVQPIAPVTEAPKTQPTADRVWAYLDKVPIETTKAAAEAVTKKAQEEAAGMSLDLDQ